MEKLEIKIHFKQIYMKIVKTSFRKSGCHGNDLTGTDLIRNNTPIVLPRDHGATLRLGGGGGHH